MAKRLLLRRHLFAAWQDTINHAYCRQLINSERGLQVHFCHRLLEQFERDGATRLIFVEPCFRDNAGSRSPDIVICHTQKIIGVVELKYLPRISPKYRKDLRTLRWFGESNAELILSNARYRGPSISSKSYSLASDAVLCWAGVYQAPMVNIVFPVPALKDRFLSLHAITSHAKDPDVVRSGSMN